MYLATVVPVFRYIADVFLSAHSYLRAITNGFQIWNYFYLIKSTKFVVLVICFDNQPRAIVMSPNTHRPITEQFIGFPRLQ